MSDPWDLTPAQRLQFREAQAEAKHADRRSFAQKHPSHPADVTADRLGHALEQWPDEFDGRDADMIGEIIHVLRTIAERNIAPRRAGR